MTPESPSVKTFRPFYLKPASKTLLTPNSRTVSSPILFGRNRDSYAKGHEIPKPIYDLLVKAPKNELHVHQGGSSSVEFLSYSLRQAIENGEVDQLPYYHPNGTEEMVNLKTRPTGEAISPAERVDAMAKVLQLSNLRQYYRFQVQSDNQRPYMDNSQIAETTARQRPQDERISVTDPSQFNKYKANGLNDYRNTSDKMKPYTKNIPAFYMLANQYAKDVAAENIRYTEYRISPSGAMDSKINNIEEVIASVHDGFEDARNTLKQRTINLDYGLLVLFERQNRRTDTNPNAKVQRAIQLAHEVVRLKKEGKYNIVGVDLAGDEANNPITEFAEAFKIIKDYNATAKPENRLGITIHAGETAKSGPLAGHESIANAIKIASDKNTPVRIGHGLQIINSSNALRKAFQIYREHPKDWEKRIDKAELLKSSALLNTVIQNGVVLEMCPKSNLQTYGIHPGFPDETFETTRSKYSKDAYGRHPAVFLSRLGVKIAISSDNRTISNTDGANEFVKLFKYAGLTYNDFKTMVMNGFKGAFLPEKKKKAIIQDVKQQFRSLEKNPDYIKAIGMMNGKLTWPQRLRLARLNWMDKLERFLEALEKRFKQIRKYFQPKQPALS